MNTPQPEPQSLWACPACGQRSLVDHCPSPTCTWHRCRNKACDLVADFRQKHGHRLTNQGKRENWSTTT